MPPKPDENGCITDCGTCCPALKCAQPECENPIQPTTDDQGCQVDCGSCPPTTEPTCELVEKCDPKQNNCFRVQACGDKDYFFTAQFCEDAECVFTDENIPLMPCVTDNCEAVEAFDLDYADVVGCPPPPMCTTGMLMCEGSFIPTDRNGCQTGCRTCPPSMPSSPPRAQLPPPIDVIAECDQLVGAITMIEKNSTGLKLENTGESCHINDGLMYHGMWQPYSYDVVDTIDWINPDVLPCAKQWFVAGDLVCYCPCDQNTEPPRPIAPSPPQEDRKSPSPPPPREDQEVPEPASSP